MSKYVVADTEVYINYFLLAFKSVETGKVLTFEKCDDEDNKKDLDRDAIRKIMMKRTVVTFNGIPFDFPLIAAALAGKSCAELKEMADIIIRHNLKSWITEKQFDIVVPRAWDHIDLIEVAPLRASLKIYNGRLHGRKMQDLPYDPAAFLSPAQMEETKDYCVNDLDSTILLFKACEEPLTLRKTMGDQWGIDLKSKSDAQVAEGLIKERLTRKLGKKPEKPKLSDFYVFTFKVPPFIRFENERLKAIVERLRTYKFELLPNGKVSNPDFLADEPVRIGLTDYAMGIGGLHSVDKPQCFEATKEISIVDRDVKSYYPYIIITQKLTPKHIGEAFLEILTDIVETRVKEKDSIKPLKKAGKLVESKRAALNADSLKIAVNGTFGKLGSSYCVFFAPDLMVQTTISGQLMLLMAIEATEKAGMRVVSANTDGFVTLVPKDKEDVFSKIMSDWERMTSLVTEEVRYSGIYQRDVSNYLAIEIDDNDGNPGKIKAKGAFVNCWEDMENPNYRDMMQKNPESTICLEAAVKRIRYGIPVWDTIRACRDIRKFVNIRTVNGGASYDGEYLGKAIRWYYGTSSRGCIEICKSGNKVPKTDGAVPLMTLPDEFPEDVDFDYYIGEALSILSDLSVLPVVSRKNPLMSMYDKIFKQIKKNSR